jgi:hypothetical protein
MRRIKIAINTPGIIIILLSGIMEFIEKGYLPEPASPLQS